MGDVSLASLGNVPFIAAPRNDGLPELAEGEGDGAFGF